ncbi:SH3 domain-containing protein [Devosia beringensis]|uniref:hypothetical protein n=1 Tax=Devosia beringensis TaxID=2657486 RepID=UPI00186B6287|nr:hypothetical protein [Devosia beringensis]
MRLYPAALLLPVLLLAAALHGAPVLAAQTATVSGAPALHDGPGPDTPATGKNLPAGATVTIERCSNDLVSGSAAPGVAAPAPGAGDWCLVRGAGWVDGRALVNLSADPLSLLPAGDGLDPLDALGEGTPAWDDPTIDFGDPAE